MTTAAGSGPAPVGRQVLRGIAFFLGGSAALIVVATAGSWLVDRDGSSYVPVGRRIAAVAVLVFFLAGVFAVRRRVRGWGDRPSWLVPAAGLLLVGALVPALWLPAPDGDFTGNPCLPLADAWRPVVTVSAADLAFFRAGMHSGLPASVHDKASLAAYTASEKARQQTPAYRRAWRYDLWAAAGGSCAPRSRTALGASALGLGLGTAGLALAVRRRRRA